ncbi:hypothetical protein J7K74_03405 [Candidatus Woesearchaeota archaeon]|nr:hypothetical protein [Candidatus Woesearchaeota archaeon]
MEGRIPKIFKNTRVIILLVILFLALVAISPMPWRKGVVIVAVEKDSPSWNAGMRGPSPDTRPMSRERIIEINGEKINDINDYYRIESGIPENVTVVVKTNKNVYFLKNAWRNPNKKGLGIIVTNAPTSNIRKGLELVGGTRVLLKPKERVDKDQVMAAVDIIRQRLNVYGLSDISVTYTQSSTGDYYILLEVPGATEEQVRELVSSQGKFEAKIGNKTVFTGGKDITYVCRISECAGLDMNAPCTQINTNEWACRFRFRVDISPEAANRQANITKDLAIITQNGREYLNETIDLYLDDELVDKLNIGAELRGNPTTSVTISGAGSGRTQQEAIRNTLNEMKRLQTILLTGSLPVSLEIMQISQINPLLGEQFLSNIMLVGIIAIIIVAIIMFVRYRKLEISIPAIITMISEVILILGFAAMINWRLDIAGIAGILIAIGSGVDDQIVISDEVLGKTFTLARNWKERIKKAFFIVFGSYLTTVAAMIPLWSAGASLLRGFALTTIVGVSFGVFITRPAFAAVVETLLKE